ncbi:hypothetical protein MBLNU230_g0515t1 [Neophaeotheca triangularis]
MDQVSGHHEPAQTARSHPLSSPASSTSSEWNPSWSSNAGADSDRGRESPFTGFVNSLNEANQGVTQLGSDMLLDSDYDEKRVSPNDENVALITNDDDASMADDAEPTAEPFESAEPRADDHAAMWNRFMPPLPEHETESETVFTWDINNWRQLPKRTHGPQFECAGHPWRVLFFPAGNSAAESVSFYLEQGFGDNKPPEDWYACAQFMLVLSNPNDPSIYLHHEANHRFTAEEGDWGFTRFADKTKIFASKYEGKHDRPLVENDCAKMTAYVRVLKDPTGVLWHNFINYDSKKETGMVGLRNQGATCYLNSLLQSLYLTGAFRKAVYAIPTATEEDRENSQSAYCLQRLFYRLQADNMPVSTQELTHSFGWESRQIFEQQDVQELSRILMEKLEARMKGTEAEKALPDMFVGKMKTYLKCINVDYESSRTEDFWDLQLNVSGCKSVEESFNNYIEVETLEGDNKYAAEGYGLQDAKKGVIFESFPNVLHLQLKRFEYDFQRDAMMKVNDRYEFPEVFDAAPYLDETADKSQPYIYHLHGVLVHSGDLNAGHYYAFLKPEKHGEFYRFDDDRVTKATKREAIDDNFGGDYANGANGNAKGQNPYTRQWSTKRSNNAYMLVYIRENKLDEIMPPSKDIPPPEHLPAKIAEERAAAEKRRKDREEAHLYMQVQVATEANFKAHNTTDIVPWGIEYDEEPAAPAIYRLLRSMTVSDLTKYIAQQNNQDPELLRPWIMVNRQNGTIRPDNPLIWPDLTLQEAADKFSTRNSGFRVFMEETVRNAQGEPVWPSEDISVPSSPVVNGNMPQAAKPIIIFIKHFDVDKQQLQGVGHIYMNPTDKVQDLATPILQLMGWEPGVVPQLFEEIKMTYVEAMKSKNTLAASEIQDGDIVCFQRHLSEAESTAVRQINPTSSLTAPEYYDFLQNRMFVHFTPRTKPVANAPGINDDNETFTLALSKKDSYDALCIRAAEHMTQLSGNPIDPSHLRFSTVHPQSGKPRAIVKRAANVNMASILLSSGGYSGYNYTPTQAPDQLYYEVLEMSLTDLEQRKNVKVTWLSDGITKEEPYDVLVPKQSQFHEVLAALAKKASLPEETLDQVRFYEVHGNKIYKTLPLTHAVIALNEFMTIYAEKIPDEEKDMDKENGDRLVYCMHFEKEPSKSHGVPFVFLVKAGEKFKDTKERLSKRTGLRGKQFEKIRFAIVKGGQNYSRPSWVEDNDEILADRMGPDDHFGLEHANKAKASWVKYESLNIR